MALNYVTVTGTFDDGSGNPLSGTAVFTPSEDVYASGVPVASADNPITASITGGQLQSSFKLLATDNSGLSYLGQTGFFYWTVVVTLGGIARPAWSFFLPHTPTTVDLYSLANSQAGGGSSSLPLTTLGDMLYENATPAPARLGGNTSTAKQFLTQTGTGSVSAAPAWGTIAYSDLPSFTTTFTFGSSGAAPSSGTFSAGDVAVDQNGIARVCTTAGSPGTWARVGPWPSRFYPEDYGAKGNGIVTGDVNSTATSGTFTSPTVAANAVVGQWIMIHGANGSSSGPVIDTIASINTGAHTFTLTSHTAGATVSNCPAVFGTDDTTAVVNCMNAMGTYALNAGNGVGSGNYMAEMMLGPRIYILATGPTQVGNGSSTPTFNSQVPLPYPAASGNSQELIIKITGAGDGGWAQFWQSLIPNVIGSAFVSMLSAPNTPNATFGQQSVVGGPTGPEGFTSSVGGAFANVKPVITNMSVWLPPFTNIIAWDFSYCCSARCVTSNAHVFAPAGWNSSSVQPRMKDFPFNFLDSLIGIGFSMPVNQNHTDITMDDCATEGYTYSFKVHDWLSAGHLSCAYTAIALDVNREGGIGHLIAVQKMDAEGYENGLRAGGTSSQTTAVDITWSAECGTVNNDIYDPGNYLTGVIRFQDPVDTGRGITVTGAANLKIISNQMGPGHWTGTSNNQTYNPPSVPASGTAQLNNAYRDAWVSVHCAAGVTVSAIAVDGVTTGKTVAASSSNDVWVPSAKTITLTYAGGTPTWDWWLS